MPRRPTHWLGLALALFATPLFATTLFATTLFATTLFGSRAQAQDGVQVTISVSARDGSASDATVTLTPRDGEGPARSCTTQAGSCELSGVTPGDYVVTAAPSGDGRAPLPRTVPVPNGVASYEVRVRLL